MSTFTLPMTIPQALTPYGWGTRRPGRYIDMESLSAFRILSPLSLESIRTYKKDNWAAPLVS
jgi:hypothetical protein